MKFLKIFLIFAFSMNLAPALSQPKVLMDACNAIEDKERRVNYDAAMQSDEYRAKKAEESRLRNADPEYRKRVSDTLKTKLADPAVRAAMSERASKAMKASHERRRLQKLEQQKVNEINKLHGSP